MCESAVDHDLHQPLFKNGRFQNPWKTWMNPKFSGVLKFILWTKDESNIPSKSVLDKTLPVVKPDLSKFNTCPARGVQHMWIGHASSLVQFDDITILTDPIFSDRSSLFQWLGPKRYRPTPCSVQDLPPIDCVVISHNHYDHLDYNTVVALNRRFGSKLRWYVPMGLKTWMNNSGCENVVELTWWQEHVHCTEKNLRFVCTPAQHWCKRGPTDDNKVLWSSWCVLGPKHSFYFAGDTGYCSAFKEIGNKYGPFNLSAIPIGAYHPREFLKCQHVDPGQAIDVHTDIKSKQSVGIHWGTFKLTYEPYLEPRELLKTELETRNLAPSAFVTVNHGEIRTFGEDEEKEEGSAGCDDNEP